MPTLITSASASRGYIVVSSDLYTYIYFTLVKGNKRKIIIESVRRSSLRDANKCVVLLYLYAAAAAAEFCGASLLFNLCLARGKVAIKFFFMGLCVLRQKIAKVTQLNNK